RANRWKCPHCDYEQRNHRKPDLERHIRSHTASAPGNIARWVCCGVPLASAAGAEAKDEEDERRRHEPWVYAGETMIGGCRMAFSRKDALVRHLAAIPLCVGSGDAPWLIGMKEENGMKKKGKKGKGVAERE
ncbi:hypothetical protein GY45DRAFT_1238953, partial [Cubamyces sp. BRFM 1775]